MVKCSDECIPCCDYCVEAKHVWIDINGKKVKIAPEGCNKHPEEHYQSMARSCGYCRDFHCVNAEVKNGT